MVICYFSYVIRPGSALGSTFNVERLRGSTERDSLNDRKVVTTYGAADLELRLCGRSCELPVKAWRVQAFLRYEGALLRPTVPW